MCPPTSALVLPAWLKRGGGTGPHRDGWGVVFYEGKGIRAFRDSAPSVESEIARLVSRFPMKSCIAISHIREANVGQVCLENTHPFVRELWGQNWTFAHNGQLENPAELPLADFQPVGTTDSERAFCWLLAQIKQRFISREVIAGDRKAYWHQLKLWCDQLNDRGVSNLLFSEGNYLYAYCSTQLHWITRRAPLWRGPPQGCRNGGGFRRAHHRQGHCDRHCHPAAYQ